MEKTGSVRIIRKNPIRTLFLLFCLEDRGLPIFLHRRFRTGILGYSTVTKSISLMKSTIIRMSSSVIVPPAITNSTS